MPKTIYCWRCRVDIPMLTEEEWETVAPSLANAVAQIKQYRDAHGCSLAEARAKGFGRQALVAYEQITGFKETNPDALFHHRLSIYGPPCHACGKPLRTPQARYCAMCSAERPAAQTHMA
ncbi:hypothetical protein [Ideonella sp.]|uniref:hypothetical protein n=1 Tax=Ideonella sp. TaxID=1929293 RepID=UPI003BB7B331